MSDETVRLDRPRPDAPPPPPPPPRPPDRGSGLKLALILAVVALIAILAIVMLPLVLPPFRDTDDGGRAPDPVEAFAAAGTVAPTLIRAG